MTEKHEQTERTNPTGVPGAKTRQLSGAQHLAGLAAILFLASAGCSEQPSRPPATQQVPVEPVHTYRIPVADRPPASLLRLGQSAKNLFDAAGSSDWSRSGADVQSLSEAVSELPVDLPKPDLVAQLQSRVVRVTNAANSRQRIETMAVANAITQLVAELSAQYQPLVPYEVKMLGYYGRQIELGIASGRLTDSTQATSDLVTAWNRIQPAIERRGHVDYARRFNDIVVELMGAKRPADLVAPVHAELAAAARLESIFTSPE